MSINKEKLAEWRTASEINREFHWSGRVLTLIAEVERLQKLADAPDKPKYLRIGQWLVNSCSLRVEGNPGKTKWLFYVSDEDLLRRLGL